MNVKPYDFRRPDRPRSDLDQRLARWLQAASQLGGQRSGQYLPFDLEMHLTSLERQAPDEAVASLPEHAIGFRVALGGAEANTLLLWPRELALPLVLGTLGESPTEPPPERELTIIEQSLCAFLMQQLFVAVVQETWPGAAPLTLVVGPRETSPRWTRMFMLTEEVFVTRLAVRGPFGTQEACWLLPADGSLEPLLHAAAGADGSDHVPREQLEAVVRALPVEVVVDLGSVRLPLAQLAGLAPGDVLVLNQRVSEPLATRVDGQRKFLGWAGRVGSRQSLQIESLIG